MTEKGYYVDSDGDLYKREPKRILMPDFGFCEHIYVQRVLDELNSQDKRVKELEKENNLLKNTKKAITYEPKAECVYNWDDNYNCLNCEYKMQCINANLQSDDEVCLKKNGDINGLL